MAPLEVRLADSGNLNPAEERRVQREAPIGILRVELVPGDRALTRGLSFRANRDHRAKRVTKRGVARAFWSLHRWPKPFGAERHEALCGAVHVVHREMAEPVRWDAQRARAFVQRPGLEYRRPRARA
jgi:hypothetical protein